MNLTRTVGRTVDIIPLDLFYSHLKLNTDIEMSLVKIYLDAAILRFESLTGYLLGEQTWQLTSSNWHSCYYFQKLPFVSLETFKYENTSDTLVDYTDYEIYPGFPYRVHCWSVPQDLAIRKGELVKLTFKAGVSTFADLPPDITNAVVQLATYFFYERNTVTMPSNNFFDNVVNIYKYQIGYGDWNND